MNSLDEAMEYLSHRRKEKKKGSRLRIYSIEDYLEYLRVAHEECIQGLQGD